MRPDLNSLGYARVFRHPRTGELLVDTDSLRRAALSGFGEDPDDDDGDDDEFEGDDDEFEGDDDDDDGGAGDDDDDTELGRSKKNKRNKRKGRRNRRGSSSQSNQQHSGGRVKWVKTVISSNVVLADAGVATVVVRVQHHFKAQDITFDGSLAGSMIQSIMFGDRVVWSVPGAGVPIAVFGTTSMLRGILTGQKIQGGLDIQITGTLPGAGTLIATLAGQKPASG
jgi:hypothetical protein